MTGETDLSLTPAEYARLWRDKKRAEETARRDKKLAEKAARRTEAAKLYAEGLTVAQVKERVGLANRTIAKAVHAAGGQMRKTGPAPTGPRAPNYRDIEMYDLRKAGQTLEQIGQHFGITRERVRRLLAKHFPEFDQSEVKRQAYRRGAAQRIAKRREAA